MTDDLPLRRIKSVEARQGYRVALSWDRGRPAVVDLSDMVSRGGVFSALSDLEAFAAVRVGREGRVIEWPKPLDDLGHPLIEIDAEALHQKGSTQQDANLAAAMRRAIDATRKRSNVVGAKSKSRE